ncbi:MAG TPA: penicillin acylase family protein [Bryobacteraceae bacterium]|nr:penicillin acylase family protein [Bryobacteraceae bacterium]
MKQLLLILFLTSGVRAENIALPGLQQPVEVLRDKWGVPHIYAKTTGDLFFAQGYMAARDRLFQLDLWRRINSGNLAEVQGPSALRRDRIARLVRFRGDWDKEWRTYAPDAKEIVSSFVRGINGYIDSLHGKLPLEFRLAGYAPGKWTPEDCVARVAGLLMTRNLLKEVERAMDVRDYGLELSLKVRPLDPLIRLEVPAGLDLKPFSPEILQDYQAAIGVGRIEVEQGSNNWVIDGTRSATGKPLLANDPHRPINIPSLRKTVHLVGPGWNVIGAGEPALPGIALGHNEEVAFGFTIVGIDQADLYVERLNPANAGEYFYKGSWRKMDKIQEKVMVKGRGAETVDLHYTVHGPVIFEDSKNQRAYALKWVGAEPGGAGYLGALSLSRAKNWKEFLKSVANYKVPSENIVYADRAGNIGWVASGLAPIRRNWSGLLPVPGDSGDYEWSGFLRIDQHPQEYNPARHWIATANHNILPKGYGKALNYEWAAPFRHQRLVELLQGDRKLSTADFERMQQDVTSVAAKQFQQVLRKHAAAAKAPMKEIYDRMLRWDARMSADSVEAMIFSVWMARLPEFLVDSPIASRMEPATTLRLLDTEKDDRALRLAYDRTLLHLEKTLGKDRKQWQWGKVHTIQFEHPLRVPAKYAAQFHRGPIPRPGDGNTVNAASGTNFRQTNGGSYRQIIDVSDWDRSVMTNVPGESGDPQSPHYSDLLEDWAAGRYHPSPYSRKAVEEATTERIQLIPAVK